jgi:hypothetical protein
MMYQTKKASPEQVTVYQDQGMDIEIKYSSPGVKGRTIFGDLVPFDVVWRTGANEATTFETSTELMIGDQNLAAGTYSFWTIPNETEWTFIWNSKEYSWGVNWENMASREEAFDVIIVKVASQELSELQENLSIDIVNGHPSTLELKWEHTLVSVPIVKP